MILPLLLLAAIAASPTGRPAEPQATAVIEWRHEPQDSVIVDETLWHCSGNACTGNLIDAGQLPMIACRYAHRSGKVVRFILPSRELTRAELDRCNR